MAEHINLKTLNRLAQIERTNPEVVISLANKEIFRGFMWQGREGSDILKKYEDREVDLASIYHDPYSGDDVVRIFIFLLDNASDIETSTVGELLEYVGAEEMNQTLLDPDGFLEELGEEKELSDEEHGERFFKMLEIEREVREKECKSITFVDGKEGPEVIFQPVE